MWWESCDLTEVGELAAPLHQLVGTLLATQLDIGGHRPAVVPPPAPPEFDELPGSSSGLVTTYLVKADRPYAVRIIWSARKHDVDDDDIKHALEHHWGTDATDDEGLVMVIGPSRNAVPLELGVVMSDADDLVVVHAMPARDKYLGR